MNNVEKILIDVNLYAVRKNLDIINDVALGHKVCSFLYNEIFFNSTADTTLQTVITSAVRNSIKVK